MKKCSQCRQIKPLDDFYKDKRAKDGLQCECKECHKQYKQNPETKRIWVYKNKDKKRESNKRWMLENPEKYRLAKKKNQDKDTTKIMVNNRSKLYRENNREKEKARCENWRKNNIERARAVGRLQRKKRMQKLEYRIASSLSRAIYQALKENKEGGKWRSNVGYTMTELRQHLESQFIKGMSWDNYGKWHIDHVIPQAFFEYGSVNEVEFKMCWRLENLQPLWAIDNLRKSNKLSPAFRVA